MVIVRYADDIVVGFEHEADARRFRDAMRARLEAFALTLHPDKTRLLEFGRFAAANRARRGFGKPETFSFLGFTHICGRSRRGGGRRLQRCASDRGRPTSRRVRSGRPYSSANEGRVVWPTGCRQAKPPDHPTRYGARRRQRRSARRAAGRPTGARRPRRPPLRFASGATDGAHGPSRWRSDGARRKNAPTDVNLLLTHSA